MKNWLSDDETVGLVFLVAFASFVGGIIFALTLTSLFDGKTEAQMEEHPVDFKLDAKHDLTAAEGRSRTIYVLRGILHGGIGHRLTNADLAVYRAGDVIPNETIEQWWDIDFARCMKSITKHLPEFDDYPRLCQLAIFSWCYQLGTGCFEEFPRATEHLKKRKWNAAADEWLFSNSRTRHWSLWRKETQHRCEMEAERLQHIGFLEGYKKIGKDK